jgi:hypothetical protein
VCVPDEDDADPGFNTQCAGEYDPVHQPWLQQRGIGGLESFVGGEYRKDEGRDRSAHLSVHRAAIPISRSKTDGGVNQSYDKRVANVSNIVAVNADPCSQAGRKRLL